MLNARGRRIEDPFSPRSDPSYAERQLIASVLTRALMDLSGPNQREREDAFDWIWSEERTAFTFIWVCESIGLNAKELLREMCEQEYTMSIRHYDDKLQTERRPWRERVFQLS